MVMETSKNLMQMYKFDGKKHYVAAENNKEVIYLLVVYNLLKSIKRIKSIKTFDFKTLYTKIPYYRLKGNLKIVWR